MAPGTSANEMMREVFNEFDQDGSGTIDVAELSLALQKMKGFPLPDSELEAMMQSVDTDKSGEIDFEEFCTLMKVGSDPVEEMKAAFSAFDVDGSGSISSSEVKELLRKVGATMSDSEVDELIAVADTDGNGELDFDEFVLMMKANKAVSGQAGKAAMMMGAITKMDQMVLNGALLEKGSFCFRECSYDIPINADGCSVSVFGCTMSLGATKTPNTMKTIISGISGSVESGRMLAIIGPSGSGKTTLLNMLRLKQGPGAANGSITFNGVPFTGEIYKQHAAAVEQGSQVWPMLTPREQLSYTFKLMRPSLSAAERDAAVTEMITSLGLVGCQHTKAGSGLSGGELRRLSLCTALAKRPSLLFLDEPTTGLDSAAAAGVMDVISQLAKMANTAVICVIHQPSQAIFNKFDKVLLLSGGRTAYFGPATGIPMHFGLLGHTFPPGTSVCETAMNLINREFAADPTSVEFILDKWAKRPPMMAPERLDLVQIIPGASFSTSFWILFRRHFYLAFQDPSLFTGRIMMFIFSSLLISFYFWSARNRDQESIIPMMWALTLTNWNAIFAMVGVLPTYQMIAQKQVGEMFDGGYSYVPAVLAPMLVEMIFMIFMSAACLIPGYSILDFGWSSFATTLWLNALSLFVFESFTGIFALAGSMAVGAAGWMAGVFVMFFPLFTLEESVVWPFRMLSVLTPMRYFANSFYYAVLSEMGPFKDAVLDSSEAKGYKCDNTWIQCFGTTGIQVLNSTIDIGFMPERSAVDQIAHDVCILVTYIVLFKLTVLALTRMKVQPALPGPPQKDKIIMGETALLIKAPKREKKHLGGTPSMKAVFEFKNCSYEVAHQGGVKKILKNVSGSVESGGMLAIIAPSGAGKTTLLNLLQMKPGFGTPSGNVTLNGAPFTSALYKEHAASVAQSATVWPMLTAREQLAYSVELAQPELTFLQREKVVDDILEGLGLMEVQHTKAGNGLSGGELRRLSLACGLTKKPSLLFLDEPTSGLDSASASAVMDVVSQLAQMANTAVISVIHQPSDVIYNMFDKVLLLSGGRTAYFGPAKAVKRHFYSIGLPFPDNVSLPEAALNITNRDFAADPSKVDKALDAWAAKEKLPNGTSSPIMTPARSANMMEQLTVLTKRCIVNFSRDKTNWLGRIITHILIQVLVAVFIPGGSYSQDQIQIKIGGLILMLMITSMVPAINIPYYNAEMKLLEIEVREGKVAPLYCILASTIVEAPVLIATSAVSVSLYYSISQVSFATFGQAFGLFTAFLFVYEALAQAFSTAGVAAGMMFFTNLVDQGNTFNGIFSPIAKSEYPFKFMAAITPSRQMLTGFTYLMYSESQDYDGAKECTWFSTDRYCAAGSTFYCPEGQPCFGRTGKEILASLEYQGFDKSDIQVGPRVTVLIYYIVLFKLISVMRLYMMSKIVYPTPTR